MATELKYKGKHNELLELVYYDRDTVSSFEQLKEGELLFIWFEEDNNEVVIDNVHYTYDKNDVVFLTEFHHLRLQKVRKLSVLKWNKSFYCIVNHDSEVSCKGVLFYGARHLAKIHVEADKEDVLKTVFKMLAIELKSHDNLQQEMLQMMLKRILILCTRIYKEQRPELEQLDVSSQHDTLRTFNFLVEQHFKTLHSVSEYADLLHKSPKTLSNLFKKLGYDTPLQLIQARIILEAKRLLLYTDKGVSEIAYDLGFKDIQVFSRFFKKNTSLSPKKYREKEV